jgi:DNA-binding transcriptional LysR family regulator
MEFDAVRAFVTLADAGSVSRAARELHITQSAVTRRLQRLETSLGIGLLDRTSRPLRLTASGRAALERCRRLLGHIRELRAAATNGNLPRGELRIGVAHALTEFALAEPVERVQRKFPQVALLLRTGWSRDLLERVRTSALDGAVILLPRDEQLPANVAGKQVGKERLVVVGSRREKHLLARRVEDLSGAQWILNPEGCAARVGLRRALLHANIDLVVAVETYNYDLQLALVAQNRGLSLVPERILAHSSLKAGLRIFPIRGLNFPLTIWVVHGWPPMEFDPVIEDLSSALLKRFQ